MPRYARLIWTGLLAATLGLLFGGTAALAAPNPCDFPTHASLSPQETAWKLFVAANCPANAGKVVWENWVEQLQLYPANAGSTALLAAPPRRLHGSPLAHALAARLAATRAAALPQLAPNTECGTMQAPPKNVVATQICEEVRLNPDAARFITGAGYQVRTAQAAAAQKGTDIEFPAPAVEIKVDWIPASDFSPAFTCASPPKGVRTEEIDGTCYAMAGIHISSKLLKNWLWATFEPQSLLTNPLRCVTFGACHDAWGSVPAISHGGAAGFTHQTPALQRLMRQAGLAPAYFNYRLDGAQTVFGTAAHPTLLGNSIIEGENVGMTAGTASCISCHSQSAIKGDGTDSLASLNATVGTRYTPPAGWVARDFVWSMAFACPDPTKTGAQACQASVAAAN